MPRRFLVQIYNIYLESLFICLIKNGGRLNRLALPFRCQIKLLNTLQYNFYCNYNNGAVHQPSVIVILQYLLYLVFFCPNRYYTNYRPTSFSAIPRFITKITMSVIYFYNFISHFQTLTIFYVVGIIIFMYEFCVLRI